MIDPTLGLSITDRYHYTSINTSCFTGASAINWFLRKKYASDRHQAKLLGQRLLQYGLIERSGRKDNFEDTHIAFFRFTVRRSRHLFEGIISEKDIERLTTMQTRNTPFLSIIPMSTFAIVMGVIGIAIVFNKMNMLYQKEVLSVFGIIFAVAGVALFVLFTALYMLKMLYHFPCFWSDWLNLDKSHFFCCFSISILLIGDVSIIVNRELAIALWIIGMVFQIFLTSILVSKWVVSGVKIRDVTPVFFFPVVGLVVIAITGAKLGFINLGNFFFGAGSFYFFIIFVVFWHRILFKGMLLEKSIPRLCIAVCPPSLMATCYSLLTNDFGIFSQMLFGMALFTMILVFTIILTQYGVPFGMSFWAYLFPLTAFCNAAWTLHGFMRSTNQMAEIVSLVMAIFSTIMVLFTFSYIVVNTVWSVWRQYLLFPCFSTNKIRT
eukprot:TRINITY_DN1099_c0_g1_i1.p1 TRINITY_DN1099_c0_g1~~TRINITY_DN1099_c0_g1_i1.p1  ORF type:complete len:436 (-),score=73.64 TRINITY_DN1099_c0_g1_i1:52-1359(-)